MPTPSLARRLLGRVDGVRTTIALTIAPLGPLVTGYLLDVASEHATIAVFTAVGLILALWGTLSSAIRSAPRLSGLGAPKSALADVRE